MQMSGTRYLVGLMVGLAIVAGCGPAPDTSVGEPGSLAVSVVGSPKAMPIGGFRVEVGLLRAGWPAGHWDPKTRPTVLVAPGDYQLVLWEIGISDLTVCQISGSTQICTRDEDPPLEICRLGLSLQPGAEVAVLLRMDSGPVCQQPER
jgi:hypothetical protein